MKAFKWIGLVLGGFIALVIVAAVGVALLFDPNDYKADIERLAQERTQRKLTLQGDLKLSFFPWLAVEMGPAQLGERADFGEQPFVSFEHARLSLRFMPLLRGNVEVGQVLLEKPSIRLITDERGRRNWADLAGEEGETKPQAPSSSPSPVRATVASLRVENGAVAIDDRQAKTRTVIRDFNFTTGTISSAKPFDVNMSMIVDRDQQASTPVKLSAVVTTDFDTQQHVLKDFAFDTRWYGDTSKEKKDGVPVTMRVQSLAVDMKQQTLAMAGLKLGFGAANISGSLQAKDILNAFQATGAIEVAPLSPRDLLREIGTVPPMTRDAEVLKKFSLRAQVNVTSKSVAMQNLELKLDDTTASGQLSVVDFDSAALRFDLNLDRLNFDRYLPPPVEAKTQDADAKAAPPTPIPVDTLRALNARGDLRIGEAQFAGMKLGKLHVGVNAHDGDVRIAPTDATIYGGTYRGSLAINVAGKTPVMNVESHASGIDFAPLFKDMFQSQKISGRGQANIKVTSSGADSLAMQKTLAGNLDFNVTDGAFEGTDLWYEIKRARALLSGQAQPERTGPPRTTFTTCKGTGVIQNGVLTNNDLDMGMQFLKVGGQGTVDIVQSALNYKLNVVVLRMNDDPNAAELVDAQIPVKISGPLASPSVKADVEGMAKARVKQEVDKQKEKLQKKLQDFLRR